LVDLERLFDLWVEHYGRLEEKEMRLASRTARRMTILAIRLLEPLLPGRERNPAQRPWPASGSPLVLLLARVPPARVPPGRSRDSFAGRASVQRPVALLRH